MVDQRRRRVAAAHGEIRPQTETKSTKTELRNRRETNRKPTGKRGRDSQCSTRGQGLVRDVRKTSGKSGFREFSFEGEVCIETVFWKRQMQCGTFQSDNVHFLSRFINLLQPSTFPADQFC